MNRALLLFLLPVVVGAAQDAAPPPVAVSYTLDVTDPKSGTAKVAMVVENNRDDEVTVGIPVWAPGSYRVVAYYLGIKDLEAEAGEKKLEVSATDHKSLWKIKTGGAATFTVRYTLKPAEVLPLRGHLTEDHYDLQGPSAWLFVLGKLNGPHRVTFKLPEGWKVGTGLTRTGDSTFGADDYDTFIDCPIELGNFKLETFEEGGVSYELVLHSSEAFDVRKLVDVCRKIVAEQVRMFGKAPFSRYVFIYHFRDQRGGAGLEHLNSTHITYMMSRMKENPALIASLTSHEFFHLWNVKRIRPKELGPFDYTQPVRSKALWLCEGVTSYYGDLTLVRSGIWSRETYLSHLAREIHELQLNPARKTQSVEQAGWTVWDRGRGDLTDSIDYYNKGELLGWLLDLRIRHATKGKKTFDDVMRHLYSTYVVEQAKAGKGPIGVGFEEGGILQAVNDVTKADFTEFFARYISGTEELPYQEVIGHAGIVLSHPTLLPLSMKDLQVSSEPSRNSEARAAGVKRGDRLTKINGTDVAKAEALAQILESLRPGEKVSLQFERKDVEEPIKATVSLLEGPPALAVSAKATEEQKSLLNAWLAPSK